MRLVVWLETCGLRLVAFELGPCANFSVEFPSRSLLLSFSTTVRSEMNCNSCSRATLSLFIRSLIDARPTHSTPSILSSGYQISRFSSAAGRSQSKYAAVKHDSKSPASSRRKTALSTGRNRFQSQSRLTVAPIPNNKKEPWQVEKAVAKQKLGGEAWNPRKKLSPDTMEGIRHLHQTQPLKFTTPVLAQQFKVSPEAIRRILKSKWRPSDEEQEERGRRWDKRGERIWSNLVELGVKPPKKWREMGVGKADPGQKPRWKSRWRNTVPINDSARDEDTFDETLIPIVDGRTSEAGSTQRQFIPMTQRML